MALDQVRDQSIDLFNKGSCDPMDLGVFLQQEITSQLPLDRDAALISSSARLEYQFVSPNVDIFDLAQLGVMRPWVDGNFTRPAARRIDLAQPELWRTTTLLRLHA